MPTSNCKFPSISNLINYYITFCSVKYCTKTKSQWLIRMNSIIVPTISNNNNKTNIITTHQSMSIICQTHVLGGGFPPPSPSVLSPACPATSATMFAVGCKNQSMPKIAIVKLSGGVTLTVTVTLTL